MMRPPYRAGRLLRSLEWRGARMGAQEEATAATAVEAAVLKFS
jgi:hypothetical protein